MADKAVSDLQAADRVTESDLFVVEQQGQAKKLTGGTLELWLLKLANGHGGISSIERIGTQGLQDRYQITLVDGMPFDFVVTNGRAISSVGQISMDGLRRTYAMGFNDGTSDTFVVNDGNGIVSITKVRTEGLVDTYSIDLDDGTSRTFTVTNGAKGDQGEASRLWIKYASHQPTAESHDMGDLPDKWIGLYVGPDAYAPSDWSKYRWSQLTGDQGDVGEPAQLLETQVTYAASDSGTEAPTGGWTSNVPMVAQGRYLWTRVHVTFTSDQSYTTYSVTRMGVDGTGAVASVNGVLPDDAGNVHLNPAIISAVDNRGDAMFGLLHLYQGLDMHGSGLKHVPQPTDPLDAVNKLYVHSQFDPQSYPTEYNVYGNDYTYDIIAPAIAQPNNGATYTIIPAVSSELDSLIQLRFNNSYHSYLHVYDAGSSSYRYMNRGECVFVSGVPARVMYLAPYGWVLDTSSIGSYSTGSYPTEQSSPKPLFVISGAIDGISYMVHQANLTRVATVEEMVDAYFGAGCFTISAQQGISIPKASTRGVFSISTGTDGVLRVLYDGCRMAGTPEEFDAAVKKYVEV